MINTEPSSDDVATKAQFHRPYCLFDRIGRGYGKYRRPDARIASRILRALGSSQSVVNVGAGAGSYEPQDRTVVAVEPSEVMIGQRAPNSAPVVCAPAMAD